MTFEEADKLTPKEIIRRRFELFQQIDSLRDKYMKVFKEDAKALTAENEMLHSILMLKLR